MASPDCNGICYRFKVSISNNKAKYEDGYIRCSGCGNMVTTFEKVEQFKTDNPQFDHFGKHRCPCCHGIFKTNRRHKNQSATYKKRNSEAYKIGVPENKIETTIKASVAIKK